MPSLRIEPGHPDAGRPLLAAAAIPFIAQGALVVIAENAGNTVRPAQTEDETGATFVVEAQGLPNLLHELLHFVQAGRLADDHGFDYGLIPFDTSHSEQRQWLWDEIASCVVSCAYLADREELVAPWFAEQVGIQNAFYGFEDPARFFDHVDGLLARHGDEARAALERAYELAGKAIAAGAPECARPPRRYSIEELWRPFRDATARP